LEELFTVPGIGPEDRRLFIQVLAGLARSAAVWVIATVRADFWHRAAEIPELIALAEGQGRIDLATASPAELAEMIRKPAEAAGLSFEVHPQTGLGLDAVLAEDAAAAPGALPLLSFTLDELYKNAKARGAAVLTYASYEALGGLEGAIAKRADEIVGGLPAAAQAAMPRVLRALTTVSGVSDQTPVARSVPLETFAEGSPARTLIDAFIAARLLVAAGEGNSAATVRLAHEALISRWQRARDQLAADHRDLQTRAIVERQFGRWSQANGSARWLLLLRNPDLANAVDLAKRWGDELDAPLREFINRSARRARLAQTLAAAAAVLFAIVAATAFYAERQAVRAQQEAVNAQQEAERRQVNLLAELATGERLRGNWDTALRLGVHASRLALALDRVGAEMSMPGAALAAALSQSGLRLTLGGGKYPVYSAAFSPDGSRIVTASYDETARIWDTATRKEIMVLRGHGSVVSSAAFSPDGSRIVTASWDKTARIWDAATGKEITVLRGHEDDVNSAAFSPDGQRIVTASGALRGTKDNTARIWDAATGKEIMVLRGHETNVRSAAFSPDGTRIVTAESYDKTARIWDAATGKEITVLRGHEGIVNSAAFSPDGSRIVTASYDETARIWDAATGKEITVLRGHNDTVGSAAFSPDGTRIVTASADKTVRIWDAATGKEITVLRGHESYVLSAAFSPDGARIVTASGDKTARIWDAATGKEITVLRGHADAVRSAAFSPDGARIATASEDKTARIWDAATGKEIMVLRGHETNVRSAAFSPDGSRIVTASWDKTARIWDAATGKEITVLRGHEDDVNSAAFSPDGQRIVTASGDYPSSDDTARIWDAATGKEITVLRGHEGIVYSAAFSPDGTRIVTASWDNTARIWNVHFATMSAKDLVVEVCMRRLRGLTTLSRDEMRLAGYPDSTPEIDVCAGVGQ
jgi:WD40 repeat protein